jgi:Rrf2 family protein
LRIFLSAYLAPSTNCSASNHHSELYQADDDMLSASCGYAIRAAIFIALESNGKSVSIRLASQRLGISFHFLTKILQVLTRDELLVSQRGRGGGVTLARPSEDITVFDLIRAVDGDSLFRSCILGLPGCDDQNSCPMHERWSTQREQLMSMARNTTLAQLAADVRSGQLRIGPEDA